MTDSLIILMHDHHLTGLQERSIVLSNLNFGRLTMSKILVPLYTSVKIFVQYKRILCYLVYLDHLSEDFQYIDQIKKAKVFKVNRFIRLQVIRILIKSSAL